MRQPEPNRDSEAFLSALADELSRPPDELTSRRHVTGAASIARNARVARRSTVVRWGAAMIVVAALFGTGGIAAAGGLPAPLQSVVADVARALPLPIDVPYPTLAGQSVPNEIPADELPSPEDGETKLDPYRSVTPTTVPAPAPSQSEPDDADDVFVVDGEGDSEDCDLGEIDHLEDLDERERDELGAAIRLGCDPEFVDPPRFTDDGRTDDRDEGGWSDDDRSSDRDEWDDEDENDGDEPESGGWGDEDDGDDGDDREEERRGD